jgi:hypothetical protein
MSALSIFRTFAPLFLLGAALTCLGPGCGKKDTPPAGSSVDIIDASQLRPAFAQAPEDAKQSVEKTMMSIQSSDFKGAAAELNKLSQRSDLSAQQKSVVDSVASQVEKKRAALATPQ